jgi:hypothetical protein
MSTAGGYADITLLFHRSRDSALEAEAYMQKSKSLTVTIMLCCGVLLTEI